MAPPVPDPDGLVKAIFQNDLDKLKSFLARTNKTAMNKPIFGSEYFALRYAVEKDHVETTKMLLDFGCDPNLGVQSSYWHFINPPPLYTAAQQGCKEIVAMLIEAGANPFHEMDGKKAKTMGKTREIQQMCREAEAAWKEKEAAEKAAKPSAPPA
jgi:ankyrin repeat protein